MEGVAKRVSDAMLAAGADHAVVRWTEAAKQELNAEWDEVSLLRSTYDRHLNLMALVDGKRATLACNSMIQSDIDEAVAAVVELARGSRADEANTIAEFCSPQTFESGPAQADLDAMHSRLTEFLKWRRQRYPKVSLRGVHFDFTHVKTSLYNSNGVDLQSAVGVYTFVAMFSSRQGADVSSFNYTVWSGRDLSAPLSEVGSFDRLLGQSEEQVQTERIPEKFVGDVIITPDCVGSFVEPVTRYLRDTALISGTSVFQDSLGDVVASPNFSLHCRPTTVAKPVFFTGDGHVTANSTLIDDGVLRGDLLSLYGSQKLGRPRAPNEGGAYTIDAGDCSLADMVRSVDRGVLLCRFSGGAPSDNGDFSGIAKNSYYIEGGEVKYPLSETMVSGNLISLLKSVRNLSSETVDFGHSEAPWVQIQGLTIS